MAVATGVPYSLQNWAVVPNWEPHDPQNGPAAFDPPPTPLGSTSVSFHRWSTMSVISPRPLPHEVFETLICRLFRDLFRNCRYGGGPSSIIGASHVSANVGCPSWPPNNASRLCLPLPPGPAARRHERVRSLPVPWRAS